MAFNSLCSLLDVNGLEPLAPLLPFPKDGMTSPCPIYLVLGIETQDFAHARYAFYTDWVSDSCSGHRVKRGQGRSKI